ncbi:hypothetical protein QBC47DRAFT_371437 [Echria macrotheca]|uniref:Uncharacterized protein n=1 Tax=Echria macrotheca TaxID=438768 RepID=A0AAJ0BJU3_9PEZI|nr:hypothetical protein QBC47DRAFT_371437 [Echria macrotheca]
MPLPVAAKAGIIVASVAVAAAIALYESPELRRVAEDFRRRVAIALHSLGDNLDPDRQQEPRFNRPEDAEGFLQSRGGDAGVDADDETRRRQREELMYWNAKREEMIELKRRESEQAASPPQAASPSPRALTFDDFLRQDNGADRGTFVYNTGASRWDDQEYQGVRRRGAVEGVRGLSASMIANPFADEYGIEMDEQPGTEPEKHALSPGRDEIMSDIYAATPRDDRSAASQTLSPQSKPVVPDVLFDFDSQARSECGTTDSATVDHEKRATPAASAPGSELGDNEYMTAGQEDRGADIHASIQAWAQGSNRSFYSPLPETPVAPLSDVDVVSWGQQTPKYSPSVASGVDVANDTMSSHGDDFGVMSDEEGIPTPNSWSEVGSVVSENESVHW